MDDLTFVSKFNQPSRTTPLISSTNCAHSDEDCGKWYQEVDDGGDGTITLDLRTGGWGENEYLIQAMLDNQMLRLMCYHSWTRGGQHVFKSKRPTNTTEPTN